MEAMEAIIMEAIKMPRKIWFPQQNNCFESAAPAWILCLICFAKMLL
jgi:hypothetical protein